MESLIIQHIKNLISFLFEYSFLLPVLFALLFYKSFWKNKVVIGIVVYSLFFYFLNYFFIYFIEKKLDWLYYYLYTFVEFSFFSFFIIGYIESAKTKRLLFLTSIIFLIFIIFYYTQIPLKKIDAIPIGIETILLYIFIIPYLANQFKKEVTFQLHKQFHFWIIIGIMFYLAGTFFFNIVGNELDKSEIKKFWFYSYLADIFKNIFFAISIIKFSTSKFSKSEEIKKLPNLDFTL